MQRNKGYARNNESSESVVKVSKFIVLFPLLYLEVHGATTSIHNASVLNRCQQHMNQEKKEQTMVKTSNKGRPCTLLLTFKETVDVGN